MHLRGQGLAGTLPVEADDAILEHPDNAGLSLAGSSVGARSEVQNFHFAHPPRMVGCRVYGLSGLTRDMRESSLLVESGGGGPAPVLSALRTMPQRSGSEIATLFLRTPGTVIKYAWFAGGH